MAPHAKRSLERPEDPSSGCQYGPTTSSAAYVSDLDSFDVKGKPKEKRGRFVDRDMRFGQSRGQYKVNRKVDKTLSLRFYINDWFHTLVNTRSYRIVFAVVIVYLLLFVIFALLQVEPIRTSPTLKLPQTRKHANPTWAGTWRRRRTTAGNASRTSI